MAPATASPRTISKSPKSSKTISAPVAIYYDEDGYVELQERMVKGRKVGGGPVGRHVAGKEFLSNYVRYAPPGQLLGLARNDVHLKSMIGFCQKAAENLPKRTLRIFRETEFHKTFFPKPPATVIHYPAPLESRFAWARRHGGPGAYALSGITHTICTPSVMQSFCNMITAPYEPYDALICISRAAVATVKSVTGAYCDYLRERYGGNPKLRVHLANIPLGVDVEKYRPATAAERANERKKLGIEEDEIVVLYLGRLLYQGKVHPFPIYHGLSEAARITKKKVRLVMAGWAPNAQILSAFKEGARTFAPGITTTFVDGRAADARHRIWWAADVFAFPTDNIQETFPQCVIEAMACGLPVIAADWDGCRDQVVHGETGLLLRTSMVAGSLTSATSEFLMGEYNYDQFLGRCNQGAVVYVREAREAFTALLNNPELRSRMGRSGRERAVREFSWERVIRQYCQLWEEQDVLRRLHCQRRGSKASSPAAPECFPSPELSFASYPSAILDENCKLRTTPEDLDRLRALLSHPLTGYGQMWRCHDPAILSNVLQAAAGELTIKDLDWLLGQRGIQPQQARAAIAWLLKYGLLEAEIG